MNKILVTFRASIVESPIDLAITIAQQLEKDHRDRYMIHITGDHVDVTNSGSLIGIYAYCHQCGTAFNTQNMPRKYAWERTGDRLTRHLFCCDSCREEWLDVDRTRKKNKSDI